MFCRICGRNKSPMNILGEMICKECMKEISKVSVEDESYDQYKNFIRILLSYYISEKSLLNPVN